MSTLISFVAIATLIFIYSIFKHLYIQTSYRVFLAFWEHDLTDPQNGEFYMFFFFQKIGKNSQHIIYIKTKNQIFGS